MASPPHNIVTLIGSYVPRKCGIGIYSHDLATAIARDVYDRPLSEARDVVIAAMDDRPEGYGYGPEVALRINQHRRQDYRDAAEIINNSMVDLVSLQHEYGLFGGEWGDALLELLDRLEKPLVSTLHTILSKPEPKQADVLRQICRRSTRVIVMAEKAREILTEVYDVDAGAIRVVPHGVPDVPFGESECHKARFNISGRPTILTFGLLGPSKTIEVALDALARVVPDFPELVYIVLGATHPGVKRESGERYRLSLESRAAKLGIEKNVTFHNRYVSIDDLRAYLQAADIYTTPYRGKEQITSGTLAYAVASGKAVVSTPYWHAEELLAEDRGILVDFDDVDGFARGFHSLLADRDRRERMQRAAYDYGRQMIWPTVARRHVDIFEETRQVFRDQRATGPAEPRSLLRMSLPELRLAHLNTLTDDTGLLQHSVYATPDRHHGYSADDNARALVVCCMVWSLFQDESVLPLMRTYLAYLHYGQVSDTGRFRNFMSYDRRWLEDDGSDDCQGRILWALGHLIAHAPEPASMQLAENLFRRLHPTFQADRPLRTRAFAILGLHYYLRVHGEDTDAHGLLVDLAGQVDADIAGAESPDWPWSEEIVTYDNARIPQALIITGYVLKKPEMVDRGLRVLRWLLDIQTSPNGHISFIGNDGWHRRGVEKPTYDQQSVEAAALIGACKAAYRASGDASWLVEMRRCFEWFLGRNDLGLTMIDFKTGGCFDGLTPTGVNRNQGAESLLAWLLSLLIMHEMQTGDVPGVG
ncbi:MAG: glycosyltransferase [Phycisphaerae bacterium]